MSLPRPRRLVGAAVAVALTAATAVTSTAVLTPATAAAATTQAYGYLLTAGPHLSKGRGHEWMGAYSVDGSAPGYCIDYGKTTPAVRSWDNVRSVAGLSADRALRISYVLSKWGNARTNTQGAAVNATVNILIGNASFNADWRASYVPQLNKRDRAVVPMVARMVAESAALRGPYTMTGKVTKTAAVGGSAQIRFTVLSAARKPIAGLPITIRLGNALPARALPRTTAANGTATVDLVPSAPGAVSASATGALIQTGVLRLSTPTAAPVQRLVAAANTSVRATATTAFRAAFPAQKLTAAMTCDGSCAGAPPITVSATNSSARNKLQVFVVVDGKTVPGKVLTLAPGKAGKFAVTVKDGNKVALAYRWQSGKAWTRFIAYGTAVVVDCPPAAKVDFTVDCPCDGVVTATVRDTNVSRYSHVITVEVPGKDPRSVTVAPGKQGSLAGVTWTRGQTVTVWNQNQLDGAAHGARVKVTTINFG
jgi:hypothetical protein